MAKCPVCGSNRVVHITGVKDYWQCFKCKSILVVKQEEKIG
jgi:ribosomal protein L37AE/L43A